MNKIFITFFGSIGSSVKEVNPDGTAMLDANGAVQYAKDKYRHSFIHNNTVHSVKCSEKVLTGRVALVQQTYTPAGGQPITFWTILGNVQNASQVTEVQALNALVQW